MEPDVLFVLGLVVAVLSIPAVVGAYLDGRTARVSGIIVLIGGLLIGYAISQRPGAYTVQTIPEVFMRVVGPWLN